MRRAVQLVRGTLCRLWRRPSFVRRRSLGNVDSPRDSRASTLVTRQARRDEIRRIAAFYRSLGYTPSIGPEDVLVVAELDGSLCGVVRLCQEQGVLVLRGMRVRQDVRRQGIGTRLLEATEPLVAEQECFCIPHRHLHDFYGRIGFVPIAASQAPGFLQERLARYRAEYRLDVILMRRSSRERANGL